MRTGSPCPFLLYPLDEMVSRNLLLRFVGLTLLFCVFSASTTALQSARKAPPTATVHPPSTGQPPPSGPRLSADTLRDIGRYVHHFTNRTRKARSLDTLTWDNTLSRVACAHTRDMIQRDFFQHGNPDGENPRDRVARLHRRFIGGVAENLYGQQGIGKQGKDLAAQMIEKWMESPTHRKNIIRPGLTHIGVCVLREQNRLLATQLFGKAYAYLSDPLPETVTVSDTLTVTIEQTFPPDATVVSYDVWDPRSERQIFGPYVFSDTLRMPDTTGTFQPRFSILDSGTRTTQPGPVVTVTPISENQEK